MVAPSSASRPREALELRAFSYTWPGAIAPGLAGIDLCVRPGECVWLGGPSGSGKTTLLRAIAGVLPEAGRRGGKIRVEGERPALLFQNVETQLLCTTVADEVAFGLELRDIPAPDRDQRVSSALDAFGLAAFLRRPVGDLSAGEKQRVVLAALLALKPALLLLDEPSSQLDAPGRKHLVGCLRALKSRGHAVVLADHVFEPYAELADRCVGLKEGRLVPTDGPSELPATTGELAPPSEGEAALAIENLCVRDAAGRDLLRDVSLDIAPGECVHVYGANGSGKTTLLRAAAGLLKPAQGSVRTVGVRPSAAAPLLGRVGMLFQNPERNLFERSVQEEVSFALRRMVWPRHRIEARVAEVLDRCALSQLRERSPLRLSFGEQHRVALASVLAPAPAVLLLDEPFAGLDLESRHRLLEMLAREQRRQGIAIVVASHDELPASGWAHRRLELADGALTDG
jgi:energy-coupling factor transport system ATP-binding protein